MSHWTWDNMHRLVIVGVILNNGGVIISGLIDVVQGGAVSYAAAVAQQLGKSTCIVTGW